MSDYGLSILDLYPSTLDNSDSICTLMSLLCHENPPSISINTNKPAFYLEDGYFDCLYNKRKPTPEGIVVLNERDLNSWAIASAEHLRIITEFEEFMVISRSSLEASVSLPHRSANETIEYLDKLKSQVEEFEKRKLNIQNMVKYHSRIPDNTQYAVTYALRWKSVSIMVLIEKARDLAYRLKTKMKEIDSKIESIKQFYASVENQVNK